MTPYLQLIQTLCTNLAVDFDADCEFLLIQTDDHEARVSACALHTGDEGIRIQVHVFSLPNSNDGAVADALRLIHRLNHDARSLSPWRIVLDEHDEILIEQLKQLDGSGALDVEQALVDGLQRARQLKLLLLDWIDDAPNSPTDQIHRFGNEMIFG
jgi:hypothetical protein